MLRIDGTNITIIEGTSSFKHAPNFSGLEGIFVTASKAAEGPKLTQTLVTKVYTNGDEAARNELYERIPAAGREKRVPVLRFEDDYLMEQRLPIVAAKKDREHDVLELWVEVPFDDSSQAEPV